MDEPALSTAETLVADEGLATTTGTLTPETSAPTRIANRYELLGMLGAGGMGRVYLARDAELDEVVALKLLRRDFANDAAMIARFRQEVKLARRVTHANVVRTFDLGEHGADRFITMEYVDGESLATLLERVGSLEATHALTIANGLVKGVAAAHAAGVLHRDLKPDNVLLARDGRVVITDFGIARPSEGAPARTQGLIGTPAYMAPEQVYGDRAIDARADVYAIGAVLFEMVTGRRAWPGDEPLKVAVARVLEPAPDPRSCAPIDDAFASVIVRCLARDPNDRFSSARALEDALRACRAAQASEARLPLVVGAVPPAWKAGVPVASARAIAVLPFQLAGATSDAYLAEGLTEEIIDGLSATRGLRVRPLGAVLASAAWIDPAEAGAKLGVDVVASGTIRRTATAFSIRARLTSVADGFQIWARRVECEEREMLVVAGDLAKRIADALAVELPERAREAPVDAGAVDLYLRARRELRANWSNGDLAGALSLLASARAGAPDDGNVLAVYAMARARQAFYVDADGTVLTDARLAAERAIERAPDLGEAWAALGTVLLYAGETAGRRAHFGKQRRARPGSFVPKKCSVRFSSRPGGSTKPANASRRRSRSIRRAPPRASISRASTLTSARGRASTSSSAFPTPAPKTSFSAARFPSRASRSGAPKRHASRRARSPQSHHPSSKCAARSSRSTGRRRAVASFRPMHFFASGKATPRRIFDSARRACSS